MFLIVPLVIVSCAAVPDSTVTPKPGLDQDNVALPPQAYFHFMQGYMAEIANNTDYGLTGAVYTRDENKIAEAKRRFHVGNLYFNRKCTGAFVGVHPFGGFNMSGTDSKAGGRDYLQLFLQAKLTSRAQ